MLSAIGCTDVPAAMLASTTHTSSKQSRPVQANGRKAVLSSRTGPLKPAFRCSRSASTAAAAASSTHERANLDDQTLDNDPARCPVLSSLRPLQPAILSRWQTVIAPTSVTSPESVDKALSKDKIAGHWLLGLPAVIVGDSSTVKEVIELEQKGTLVPGWPPSIRALLGKHSLILQSDPKKHRSLRRMLMPLSSQDAIEEYLPEIRQLAEETLGSWAERCASTNDVVLATPDLKSFTFAVICKVVLGLDLTREERWELEVEFRTWVKHFYTPFAINAWPFPFREAMVSRQKMVNRIMKVIHAEREAIAAEAAKGAPSTTATTTTTAPTSTSTTTGKTRRSILRRLLTERDDEGRTLSDEEAADNLLSLLFAGQDSTAAHITKILYDLATYPEVLERLRAEQEEVVAKYGPALTPKAVRAMRYAQAVSQESLRLTPPVNGVMRTSRQDLGLGGVQVPGGRIISISTSYMARNDPRWPKSTGTALDGAVFNPDRFLTPEGQEPGAQHLFGFGSHLCLGMSLAWTEVKVFLAVLARGYKFKADLNTQFQRTPIMTATNSMPLWVERL